VIREHERIINVNEQSRDLMEIKRWILTAMMLLFLVGCTAKSAQVEPSPTPDQTGSAAPAPTNVRTGVTILADGIVQSAQPPLQMVFEIGGKNLELLVQAGDQVQEGDILARLDIAVLLDSYQSAVTSAELGVLRAQQLLDALYSNASFMTAQAQMNLSLAQDELASAEYRRQVQQQGYRASEDTIAAAEANLVLAELQVEQATAEFNKYSGRSVNDPTRALALSNLAAARQQRDSILRGLNWYTGSPTNLAQALLDAEVAIAQSQLETARREWEVHKDGPDPDEIAMAEAELAVAQAQLTRSQSDLQIAMDGDVLVAPMDGIVLSLHAPAGASVGPGSPILSLLNSTQLEFHTINVSERDLAQIFLGQTALVTLKTFPDTSIEASVVRIGWQASGALGDAATFPVILQLAETDLVIRPGMTGRVEIQTEN
jgi:multidrug efflux pump subunit AcrA (membrane-fusion protein)